MKQIKLFLALGIFLIFSSISWADIPNLINFQGILDSAGNPLANKTVSVEFRIYDALVGGASLWSETQSVTTNAGGVFNVLLGSSNPIPDSVFDDTLRWLGIKVGTDAEMSPRQQIVSNAYGYRVSTVDGASGGIISGDVEIQSKLIADTVGIGTSGPFYKLHIVESNSLGDDAIRVIQQGVGDGIEVIHEGAAGSGAKFQTTNPSNATVALFVHSDGTGPLMALEKGAEIKFLMDNSGNVGIGTSSPLSQLHLESSNPISQGIRILNTSATGDPTISFLTDGVFQYTLGVDNDDGDKLQISAGSTLNSSELLTVTTAGRVGIGTTSPDPNATLHVVGTTRTTYLEGSQTGDLNISNATSINSSALLFAWFTPGTAGTERMRITTGGNVGIGTPSPLALLHVNGTAGNPSGVWSTVSDERLKKNIKPLQSALDQVLKLRGVSFEWKNPEEQGGLEGPQMGFIAQEVKQVVPEWVSSTKDNYLMVTPTGINALLVEAIKEQQKTIEDLNSQLTELRKLVREHLSVDENKLTSNQKEE